MGRGVAGSYGTHILILHFQRLLIILNLKNNNKNYVTMTSFQDAPHYLLIIIFSHLLE